MVLTETGLAKVFQRVKSFIASQLNSKASAIHTHTSSDITDLPNKYVNLTTAQTIGGNKTFTGYVIFNPYRVQIKHSSQEIGVVPSSNQWNGITFTDKNNSSTFSIEQAFFSNGNAMLHISMTPNIAGGSLLRVFESIYNPSTDEITTKSRTLIPDANNSRGLGSSSNKWKSFNGINPGALSLPSTLLSAMIQIDTTSWVLDGETDVEYTPLGDGYLTLVGNQNFVWAKGQIPNDSNFGIYRFTYKYDSDLGGIQGVTIPCIKGKKVIMKIKGTGFYNALFTYCQGNV